jgi:hypothetical protein
MKYHKNLASIPLIISLILTLFILLIKVSSPATAQTPGLDDLIDIINTIDPEEPSAHRITFTLPPDSQQINPTDYIRFRFDHYTDVSGPDQIFGTYTGSPSAQVVGSNLYISGITVPPGSELSFEYIHTINPKYALLGNYYVVIYVQEDFAGTIVKNYASTVPTLYVPFINVSAVVGNPTAELQISGLAAPYTYVIINDGLVVLGTAYTGQDGYYSRLFTGIPGGTHSMSFYGIDQQNRNTSTISVDINTPEYQRTTLSDQLLSPTIQVDDILIAPGEAIYATGSAAPNTTINIFTDSPLRSYATTASASGYWSYTISDSGNYSPGDYRLYTMAQTGIGIQSIFSPAIMFTITGTQGTGGTACGDISEGDLNCDSSINLVDFSILMYYWSTDSEAADINSDGLVNLTDFSIMMYYWGT